MSPLRRRIIQDMTIRNFVPKTQHDYIRSVKNLTMFLGRSPDTATNEDVRRFQLHLSSDGISAASGRSDYLEKSLDRNTTGRSAPLCSSKNLRDARSSITSRSRIN